MEISVAYGAVCLTKVGALAVRGQSEDENPHDGELTFLGRVLAQLPVSQQLGKLIVLGHVFGCLDDCLIIGRCGQGAEGGRGPRVSLCVSSVSGRSVLEELLRDAFQAASGWIQVFHTRTVRATLFTGLL